MLKLTQSDYATLRRHGEETYPHECCGVLLGRMDDDGSRIVTSTARCGNTRTDSPQNRYNIDPGSWCAFSAKAASAARISLASITPIPTILLTGRRPIWPKPTGSAAPTSSPAWTRGRP